MIHLPLIAVVVGMLLIVLSYHWPDMIGKVVWSDEDARENLEARAKVHQLLGEHAHAGNDTGHEDAAEKTAALNAERQRYRRSEAELQRAQSLRSTTAAVLKWTGAVFSLLGGVGYLLARQIGAA